MFFLKKMICNHKIKFSSDNYFCIDCKKQFLFDKNNVLCINTNSYSIPSFYNTMEFQRWLDIWEEESKNWKIYSHKFFRFFSESAHRKIVSLLESKSIDEVFEIGCGTGKLLDFIEPNIYIGFDTNYESLKLLKNKFHNALCIHGDGLSLPVADSSVNCIVCIHTLEHIYDLAKFFDEIKRILKTNGIFIFAIPTEGGLAWKYGRNFVTGPHLKSKYNLDVHHIMEREHINDANRVLKFIKFYFNYSKIFYWPFNFLKILSFNSTIYGYCVNK